LHDDVERPRRDGRGHAHGHADRVTDFDGRRLTDGDAHWFTNVDGDRFSDRGSHCITDGVSFGACGGDPDGHADRDGDE
jgi:hypothetical protein